MTLNSLMISFNVIKFLLLYANTLERLGSFCHHLYLPNVSIEWLYPKGMSFGIIGEMEEKKETTLDREALGEVGHGEQNTSQYL